MTSDVPPDAPAGTRLEVELLPDGRLKAPHPATRELLRSRLRHAELLPTGPGWAVARSIAPDGGAPPESLQREVVVAGTLGDQGVSLIDFIGFLATGYQTGVLSVADNHAERSVYFHDGDVVWASSSAKEDRLGEILLRRGRVTREQIQIALQDDRIRLGRACVERGFLAAHELWGMVQAQMTQIFDQLLRTESGVWSFARSNVQTVAESRIHLSTQGLLMDGLRRLDEMRLYRKRIRSAELRLERRVSLSEIVSLPDDVRAKLGPVDVAELDGFLRGLSGASSLFDVMRVTGLGEFEVTRIAFYALEAELVTLAEPFETGPIPRRHDPAEDAALQEVTHVYSMALKEMFDELRRLRRDGELEASVLEYLRDPSTRHRDIFRLVAFDTEGRIREDSLLLGLGEQGVGVIALNHALSEVMFFALFQATEILGQRRGDDLARRVKLIHGMLPRRAESGD